MRRLVALAVVLVVFLGACGGDGAQPDTREDPSPQGTRVIALDFEYQPATIDVLAGSKLTLVNRGYSFHDLKVEGQGALLIPEVASGGSGTAIVDLAPGRYTIFCTIDNHREDGMEGILTVQ